MLSWFALAPAIDSGQQFGNANLKHLDIAAERHKFEAEFSKEEIDCYVKFAVNICLDKIGSQRRSAMVLLKQEVHLSVDADHKEKKTRQINKLQAKTPLRKLRKRLI